MSEDMVAAGSVRRWWPDSTLMLRLDESTGEELVSLVPGIRYRAVGHELLRAEQHAALREAFVQLPPRCQQLITMLIDDPPVPYAAAEAVQRVQRVIQPAWGLRGTSSQGIAAMPSGPWYRLRRKSWRA
jgi:hypothetical protein